MLRCWVHGGRDGRALSCEVVARIAGASDSGGRGCHARQATAADGGGASHAGAAAAVCVVCTAVSRVSEAHAAPRVSECGVCAANRSCLSRPHSSAPQHWTRQQRHCPGPACIEAGRPRHSAARPLPTAERQTKRLSCQVGATHCGKRQKKRATVICSVAAGAARRGTVVDAFTRGGAAVPSALSDSPAPARTLRPAAQVPRPSETEERRPALQACSHPHHRSAQRAHHSRVLFDSQRVRWMETQRCSSVWSEKD